MDLLLHPKVDKAVTNFIKQPSHALLIVGANGMGKAALANYIGFQLLSVDENSITQYPYFRHLRATNNSISIADVRELQSFTSLKTPGQQTIRRLILIEYAEMMTIEAQNAFLKLLEEPPTDTVIIMTVTNLRAVLPTIQSRAQKIVLKPLENKEIVSYFETQKYSDQDIKQANNLSGNRIGLMAAILENSSDHMLVKGVETAKKVLSLPLFERLGLIDNLAKQKDDLPVLLEAMRRISRIMLAKSSERDETIEIKKWHRRIAVILKTEVLLGKNAQPKLLLTNLFINL
jgi:DNA polymerase-3 subunit delta'